MFKFTDYVYEIWTIARSKQEPIDIAYDMFRADVVQGKALSYNTGGALSGFDFEEVKEKWDACTAEEHSDAYEHWHDVIANEGTYNQLARAFPDKAKMAEIIAGTERDLNKKEE